MKLLSMLVLLSLSTSAHALTKRQWRKMQGEAPIAAEPAPQEDHVERAQAPVVQVEQPKTIMPSTTLCPDGTYVGGSRCVLTPDGKYVGGN